MQLHLGRLIYSLYYKPLDVLSKTYATGFCKTFQIKTEQKKMYKAALKLKELTYANEPTVMVHFLTGKKYWFQTAFCLYSLQKNAGVNIHATIVDDGSFDDDLEASVKRQFPTTVNVVRASVISKLLEEKLPQSAFPVLRQRRLVYPHLRKLTDVHILPGADIKLVLDSDMLFFQKPIALLNWLNSPETFLFMRDSQESYGYTHPLMKKLSGASTIPDRLNVGVAGITSSAINWQELERWTDQLLKIEGSSYLQEQALTAMLAANVSHKILDEQAYKVLPIINGSKIPEVLHHYVAEAKYDYFVKGWKRALT